MRENLRPVSRPTPGPSWFILALVTLWIQFRDSYGLVAHHHGSVKPEDREYEAIRIYDDLDSGDVVYSFRHLHQGFRTLLPDSDLFFIANADRDVVLSRHLTSLDAGKEYDFLVVEESSAINSAAKYKIRKLRISILSSKDKFRFTQSLYHGKISENLPPGSKIYTDGEVSLCGGSMSGFNSVRFEIRSFTNKSLYEDPVILEPILDHPNSYSCQYLNLKSNVEFDYERQTAVKLYLQAVDDLDEVLAECVLGIDILNENDNLPIFKSDFYDFSYDPLNHPHPVVGVVHAYDADGDAIAYENLDKTSTCCLVVPQTGEIMAIRDIVNETILQV